MPQLCRELVTVQYKQDSGKLTKHVKCTLWFLVPRYITGNNYLCTYDLYGPVRNVFDAGRYITGQVGGCRAPEIEFFWPCEMAS
jgi:hypothetical protein